MRKLSCVVAVAAVALAMVGVGASTASAAPKAPNTFVEMSEDWNGSGVVRLWWNTANGGIHGEITDPSYGGELDVKVVDQNGNSLRSAFIQGPGTANTTEVFTNVPVHACGKNSRWFPAPPC